MNVRRFALEALTLIAAAVLCALVSNALAARERKLVLQGFYPNAQRVPAQEVTGLRGPEVPTPAPQAAPVTQPEPTTATVTTTTAAPPTTTTSQPRNPATSQPTPTPATQKPSNPAPQPPPPAAPDLTKFTAHPDKPYIEIGYADVNALHDAGALFLDARRTSVYEQGHIAGARPYSVWESDIDEKVRKIFDERSDPREQAKPIVVYCSGGECEDSHMLAQKLWGIQFNNVYVYKDGYPDWVTHRGATRTGPTP